jgi:hypothetical protein
MRTNDATCAATDDTAAWLRLLPESFVNLQFAPDEESPKLSNLADYFFASKKLPDRQFTVIIPENPGEKDLSRASMLLARLGSMAGYTGLNVNLSFGTPKNSYENQIYLGGPSLFPLLSNLNVKIPATNEGFKGVDTQSGIIQLTRSTKGGGLVLVISGNTEEATDRAAGAIFDNRGLALLQGEYALIGVDSVYKYSPENARTSLNPIPANGQNFLGNLGFGNQMVNGIGQQVSRFSFFLPAGKAVTSDATLGIDYTYSSLVDPKKASLTVLVNDVALQAVALPSRNSSVTDLKTSRMNLNIPRNLLRSGDNAIQFNWNLLPDSSITFCNTSETRNLWGTIFNTSELNLKLGENNSYGFELKDLPYPFSGNKNTTLVVIPEKPSAHELRIAAHLVAELGRTQPDGKLDQVALTLDTKITPEQLGKNHLVLIGTPANNRVLAEANSRLPVRWDSELGRTLLTNWDMKLTVTDIGQTGILQSMPSIWSNPIPLSNRLGMLVVSIPAAPTETGLESYISAIARRLYIGKYNGNVMIVDGAGKIKLFNTAKEAPVLDSSNVTPRTGVAAPPTLIINDNQATSPKPNAISRDNSIILLGTAGITLVLIVLFIIFVRMARRNQQGGH